MVDSRIGLTTKQFQALMDYIDFREEAHFDLEGEFAKSDTFEETERYVEIQRRLTQERLKLRKILVVRGKR